MLNELMERVKTFISPKNKKKIDNAIRDGRHLEDLKTRLTRVINRQAPHVLKVEGLHRIPREVKRDAILAVYLNECQFAGEVMKDGRHKYYLKDGEWIEREDNVA